MWGTGNAPVVKVDWLRSVVELQRWTQSWPMYSIATEVHLHMMRSNLTRQCIHIQLRVDTKYCLCPISVQLTIHHTTLSSWNHDMHISILLDFCEWDISMVWCKTAVTTVRQQWSYCSLARSHRYIDHRRIPLQKASNVELRVFPYCWPEQAVKQSSCHLFQTPWRLCDVTAMVWLMPALWEK